MGRKKKPEEWRGVEYYLVNEAAIRQAVTETRQEFSYLRTSGSGDGRGTKRADRTAALAVKLSAELPAIVLDDGQTIRQPESWLAVFDEVRKRAAELARPEYIFDTWAARYENGGGRSFGELLEGGLERGNRSDDLILWIIENTEEAAAARGLLDEKDFLLYRKAVQFVETCKPRRLD